MQVESKVKALLGREKLVGVVGLVVVGMAASYALATKSTAKSDALTAVGDSFILVHLGEAKNYSEANAFCAEEYNTHLAVIEDSDANQRFTDALAPYSPVSAWIGFADLQNADDFEWVDANPNAYVNWDLGEPTDLCVQMLAATGTWKDVDCVETTTAFFCESPPEMIATAVVRVDCIETHSLATAVNSAEAQAYCQSIGEELYSVIDEADNGRIQAALTALNLDSAFFGLQTAAASYQWVDGRALDFDEWADGQPLESEFSLMRASDGQWLTACADERVLGVVCTACISQPLLEQNVVFKLDGITTPETGKNMGTVTLLNSYRISFGLFIHSDSFVGAVNVFAVDAGEPMYDGYGANPRLRLSGSSLFVQWATPNGPSTFVCMPNYVGAVGQWMEVELLAEPGFVQLSVDGEEFCRRDGDWVGHNREATVWIAPEYPLYGDIADADVRDFTIQTW